MKFPGKRKNKHYFPVTQRGRIPFNHDPSKEGMPYVVGIDQVLVDIEALVDDQSIINYGLEKGQSTILDEEKAQYIYQSLKEKDLIVGEYPGGAIGNTLHNFSVLSSSESLLLGVINKNITLGDYAYNYICNTSSLVDLSHLRPCNGPMGRAICLISPDGERTFGISKGRMNDLTESDIDGPLINEASLLLISAYLLRDEKAPIFDATIKACKLANQAQVPVVMSLGSNGLVSEKKDFLLQFVKDYVNVLAMNDLEAAAFSGQDDPLLAGQMCLDLVDLALITVGKHGLYLCGHVDQELARHTKEQLHSKSIAEYNKFEYSRAMLKQNCKNPIKVYTHINPFMGGPGSITSTNGAGDAALAALLHDMIANNFHRKIVPRSPKHRWPFLTYSSLSQVSKYSNRVSYEVLVQNSPRLLKGLPEKEDSLEESYWAR